MKKTKPAGKAGSSRSHEDTTPPADELQIEAAAEVAEPGDADGELEDADDQGEEPEDAGHDSQDAGHDDEEPERHGECDIPDGISISDLHDQVVAIIRHPRDTLPGKLFLNCTSKLYPTTNDCDFGLVVELRRRGIMTPCHLARALAAKPDKHAMGKGREYIWDTVERALDVFEHPASEATGPAGFTIERVRMFDSDESVFELVVSHDSARKTIKLTPAQLFTRKAYQQRVLAVCGFIPEVPPKDREWHEAVNELIATRGEHHPLPPESTEDGYAERVVIDALMSSTKKADAVLEDLKRKGTTGSLGKSRQWVVMGSALLPTVQEKLHGMTITQMGRHLRRLGCQRRNKKIYSDASKKTVQAKVWVIPRRLRPTEE